MTPTITKKFKDAMAGSALSLLTLAAGSLTASVQPAFAHRGAASSLEETPLDMAIRLERDWTNKRNSKALQELAYEQQTSFSGDGRIVSTGMETYAISEHAPQARLKRTDLAYVKKWARYNIKLMADQNPFSYGRSAEEFEKNYNAFLNSRYGGFSLMERSPVKAYYYATSNRVCILETPSKQVCDAANKLTEGTQIWRDIQSIRAYRENLMSDTPRFMINTPKFSP